jgi:acyl-CoA reductase-like NAD-dependent aldehyde dehydrogenase
MKFQTDQEAVDLANDCNFGLGCAVFSKDKRRATAIASKIHCGMATINDFATTYMSQVRKGPGSGSMVVLLYCFPL